MKKIVFGIIFLFGSLTADVIAVASMGEEVNSAISSKAARASCYILLNEKGEISKTVQNPYANIRGGASAKAVGLFKEHQVNHLIAVEVGSKMESALQAANITYTLQSGSVQNVIDGLKK